MQTIALFKTEIVLIYVNIHHSTILVGGEDHSTNLERAKSSLLFFFSLVIHDSRMQFDTSYINVQLQILLLVHDVESHWSCSHICT